MKKVDKTLAVPLHVQLLQIIKDMITSGELQPGNYLMPEREICKVQGISRMTVNKAILNLVNEGLLDRQQGKGTFVAYEKTKHRYEKLEGFTQIMNKRGFEVANKLLMFELGERSEKVQQKLKMKQATGYKLQRIRYIDKEPLVLETVYLNREMCPDLTAQLVEENSLYELYRERYEHKTVRAEQVITPVMLTKEQAKLLEQEDKTLALRIDRVVYTDKDEVMEYTVSIFMSNKHDFEVVLHET